MVRMHLADSGRLASRWIWPMNLLVWIISGGNFVAFKLGVASMPPFAMIGARLLISGSALMALSRALAMSESAITERKSNRPPRSAMSSNTLSSRPRLDSKAVFRYAQTMA